MDARLDGRTAGRFRQPLHAIETEKFDPSLPLAFKMAQFVDAGSRTPSSPSMDTKRLEYFEEALASSFTAE